MTVKIGIIGGTGVYDPNILKEIREETLNTKYGKVTVKIGTYLDEEIAFLPRHGAGHKVPPHKINYRANIYALQELGVEKIIATAAVGSLNLDMKLGDFVLLDQFIDFTKDRVQTFYEGEEGVVHVDFTEPYCPELRELLQKASKEVGLKVQPIGNYVCTEGPRFETPAEIKMFKQWGGDLVGMTSVPEVILAREAEICYATVAMVTNFAAGISPKPLTHAEVVEIMAENTKNLQSLIMKAIELNEAERNCLCKEALKELGQF